jgi:NAD(P)-dependent dehydrogenase (short-subunit alcohol dehydrogenase family)
MVSTDLNPVNAGSIAVVTGGGSGMGRELGDPDLSRGTEGLQTRRWRRQVSSEPVSEAEILC